MTVEGEKTVSASRSKSGFSSCSSYIFLHVR